VAVRPPHIVRLRFEIFDRRPAPTVGAQAGLVAVSDELGEVHEVLATWSDATRLESLPACLPDRFLGRAFTSERAVLEPSRHTPGSG
jgi:hypothetical protein